MKHIKNIIARIKYNKSVRRQCEEVKSRLMADYVEATPIPNIYKVVFINKCSEGYDKYNLYNAKENFYLFNCCKVVLKHLKYGLYFVREYDRYIEDWVTGIFDASANCFVYPKKTSLKIRQFPNSKTDTILLESKNEFIVFNLKTKLVECVTVI